MAALTEATTGRIYDLWAWCYDKTFGALLSNRHARAIEQLRAAPGDRVLDIGVGTGMSLPHYPARVTVVGLDLSSGMLRQADEKRRLHRLRDCHLVRADAMKLPFPDRSFDHIVMTHTISVVSDPDRLMREALRLLRPGGRVVLLNHFLSSIPLVAWFEKTTNPLFTRMGWRSDLDAEQLIRDSGVHVEYRFKTRWVDFWQILVVRHGPTPAGSDAQAPARSAPTPEQVERGGRGGHERPGRATTGGLALGLGG